MEWEGNMKELFYNILFKVLNSKRFYSNKFYFCLRKIFKFIVNIIYPIYYKVNKIKYLGVDPASNERVVVTLTSFPERINDVWLCVETLLRQTIKPNKIILWLAKSQFPEGNGVPNSLKKLERWGLEIRFCEDLRSHKKYYYSMLNYPEYNIITVDDDMLYPNYLIEHLLKSSKQNPRTICCFRGHYITFDEKTRKVKPYNSWSRNKKNIPSYTLCPTGCGGVLYPVNSLDKEVFNKNSIKNLCLNADDLWLKIMALKNGTKSIKVTEKSFDFFDIISTQKIKLTENNVLNNHNDIQLKNILDTYKINLYDLCNEK